MYIWELNGQKRGLPDDTAALPTGNVQYLYTRAMETDRKWIIVRVDGKLAGISMDYGRLAEISARIAQACLPSECTADRSAARKGRKKTTDRKNVLPYGEITAKAVTFEEVLALKPVVRWEDLMLFGTDFQKMVWRKLWEISHPDIVTGSSKGTDGQNQPEDKADNIQTGQGREARPHLLSYSDFAELCDNRAGVRAVAHAIALNPLPVVIPCHLIVPKESIDKILEIQNKAQTTIFKGDDLCLTSILLDPAIDFGEYALGKDLKRRLISLDVTS